MRRRYRVGWMGAGICGTSRYTLEGARRAAYTQSLKYGWTTIHVHDVKSQRHVISYRQGERVTP